MPLEIERKFLVKGEAWRAQAEPTDIRQGYLAREERCVVRVRVAGGCAWLTVKSRVVGITRSEYEYEIPYAQGEEMLGLCAKPIMEKRRHRVAFCGMTWEVDEFLGENSGLIVAEVELTSADQNVTLPEWVGEEVTGDPRYYNSNLLIHPFQQWTR
ncbi:MAG: adenylate cyclase [Chthoniobacteraceae bacterium]|nr:adenylate cyclase [Chthoniobacteraceae bacterium]